MDLISDWLNLGVRWLHVIVGIAWIGASFYFNWLLLRLTNPDEPDELVQGELWAIHAGGFFRVQKRRLPPGTLPDPLHWFKWEAYWTWISGFALLVLMYYVNADRYLIDPAVADLNKWTAIGIGLATLFFGTGVYDALWRSPLNQYKRTLTIVCCVLLAVVAYLLTQVFSGRGAFMHVGALLGTIMVANVAHVIMPSQRQMVAATLARSEADPALAASAGMRSLHNNYLTLPVVVVMLSSHYPLTYGHPHAWLVLLGLFAASALIRHFFNIRWAAGNVRSGWLLACGILSFVLVAWLASITGSTYAAPSDAGQPAADMKTVQAIVAQRCGACHARNPTLLPQPGKGMVLESPADIVKHASAIYAQTVQTRVMPLGNVTKMTDEERAQLSLWYNAGAQAQ